MWYEQLLSGALVAAAFFLSILIYYFDELTHIRLQRQVKRHHPLPCALTEEQIGRRRMSEIEAHESLL